MNQTFPFAAVVGQPDLKLALVLNAINPHVGGVLVRGPRGTGKSTLARGLTELIPEQTYRKECPFRCHPEADHDCPVCDKRDQVDVERGRPRFTELPLGASPEQVVGSLNVEAALSDADLKLDPGILARANRGVLYVDEINLLPDRLVDLILDAAASGTHTVEREGLSIEHPAQFTLVGTMNPEEGHLRPQLRDRFGLCVDSETVSDPERRRILSERSESFDRSPRDFQSQWAEAQDKYRSRIQNARELLDEVGLSETMGDRIAHRALDAQTPGHRADIVIRHASRALAAWNERTEVSEDDVDRAAELALNHRRPQGPPPGNERDTQDRKDQDPFGSGDDDSGSSYSGEETVLSPDNSETFLRDIESNEPERKTNNTSQNDFDRTRDTQGRLNVYRTIQNAARRGRSNRSSLALKSDDLYFDEDQTRENQLTVFLLDTSGSMASRGLISRVKGMLLQTLRSRNFRQWVSLVEFRASGGNVRVNPTRSYQSLIETLDTLPVGGETPIRNGVRTAHQVLDNFKPKGVVGSRRLVLVSDGRFRITRDLERELKRIRQISDLLFVDADESGQKWGSLKTLARTVGSDYRRMSRNVA